jgi:hypothetical protein
MTVQQRQKQQAANKHEMKFNAANDFENIQH